MPALSTADKLSALGIAVDFVTPLDQVAPRVDGLTRREMLRQLRQRRIEFSHGEEIVGRDGDEVTLRETADGSERRLSGIDAVVVSAGSDPVNDPATSLRGRVAQIHTIGDAKLPQTVAEATFEGGNVGRTV